MFGLFGIMATLVTLYASLIWLGLREREEEDQRNYSEWIEACGGEESPWLNPEIRTSPYAEPDQVPDLVRVYPASQRPLSHQTAERAETYDVTARQHLLSQQDVSLSQSIVTDNSGEEWLIQNEVYFPLEVPPKQIEDQHGLRALEEARYWIKKALRAGLSQNQVQREMFGLSPGTNGKAGRISTIYKEEKELM